MSELREEAESGNLQKVKNLLRAGANVNEKDNKVSELLTC